MEAARKRLSYAEYLALQSASAVKHEFVAGMVVAMAGGTIEHGRLAGQLTVLLRRAHQLLPGDAPAATTVAPSDRLCRELAVPGSAEELGH